MKPILANIFKSQLFKNSSWLLADVIAYPLIMIVATPFFINNLGPEQYGFWMLINVIVQLMNALNFGVGESTIKATSNYNAQQNVNLLNQSFNYNLALSILLMLLASGIGFILAGLVKHYHLFSIAPAIKHQAYTAIILCAISAGLKFIEQVFLSLFKGLQRFDVSSRLNMLSRVSTLLAAIIVVHFGKSFLEIVITTLVINLLNLIIQAFVVLAYTEVKFKLPEFKHHTQELMFKNNVWFWIQSVIALFGFLGDRLIIGELANLETVGYYSIAALIGSQIHNVLLALGSFIFPKVTANNALNKDTLNIYYLSRFFISGLGWFVILLLLFLGEYIFKWWLGPDVFLKSYLYIKLYLVYSAVILLITVPFHFINGSNHVKLNSLFEIILRSMHLVAMFIAYQYYEIQGLLWALIIVTIINIPFQYYLFNKYLFKMDNIPKAIAPVLPAICIVLLALSEWWLIQLIMVVAFIVLFKYIYFDKVKPVYLNFINQKNG